MIILKLCFLQKKKKKPKDGMNKKLLVVFLPVFFLNFNVTSMNTTLTFEYSTLFSQSIIHRLKV